MRFLRKAELRFHWGSCSGFSRLIMAMADCTEDSMATIVRVTGAGSQMVLTVLNTPDSIYMGQPEAVWSNLYHPSSQMEKLRAKWWVALTSCSSTAAQRRQPA